MYKFINVLYNMRDRGDVSLSNMTRLQASSLLIISIIFIIIIIIYPRLL